MNGSIFSSLVSITNGLQRDNRQEKDFKYLLSDFKLNPKANNAVFKVNFKKPLNALKHTLRMLLKALSKPSTTLKRPVKSL